MKKILLIGKTGQLGQMVMAEARSFAFEIAGFDSDELNVLEMTQIEERLSQIKPDILINTAAYHVVPRCEENPLAAMAVNFLAVQDLAELCWERNITFVTYSTDYVFDGRKGQSYLETDWPHPLQVYGLSKLAGEYAALSRHPGGTFIIRSCGIFGGKGGSRQKGGNFVLNILEEARKKDIIEVSSEQVVSPTYAGDLSQATLRLLKNEKAKPGIYHLVNEGYCSWYEFTKEIFKLAKVNKELRPVDRKGLSGEMKRPIFSALANTKAKAFGIILPQWQEGLKTYFSFLNSL